MSGIFISYGRRDAWEVALALKGRLEAHGHRVWLDKHELPDKVSGNWDREIERNIEDRDVFLALLSPRAVEPDSVCRNELSHALDSRKHIVPVMVRACALPLRINMLQYLDLEGWHERPQLIEEQLERLLEAIEHGLPEDPHLQDLRSRYRALDFGEDFARHRRFTGRIQLFAQIDEWAAAPSASPVMFIVGSPGIGKSAILANWVSQRLTVGAVHFCRWDRASTRKLQNFAESVVAQLLQLNLPGYAEILRSTDLARLDPGSDEFFAKVVIEPLRHLPQDGTWVLAVDALDEAEAALAAMLGRVWRNLPPHLRLLITSRGEQEILERFPKPVILDAASETNHRDLVIHVQSELSVGLLGDRVRAAHMDANAVARTIDARSEGTFLVACEILSALTRRDLGLGDPAGWPQGLGGLHRQNLERRFPDPADFDAVRDVLALHLAGRDPVSDADVAEVAGLRPRQVQASMDKFGSLMGENQTGRRSAWHKSFFDWFTELRASDPFSLDFQEAHARWAAWCEGHLTSDYALRHAVAHHVAALEVEAAQRLLGDWNYLRGRVHMGLLWQTNSEAPRLGGAETPALERMRAFCRLFRLWGGELAGDPPQFESILLSNLPVPLIGEIARDVRLDVPALVRTNRGTPPAEVLRLTGHAGTVFSVSVSPDGRRIVSGDNDAVRIWDAESGEEIRSLTEHTALVCSVAFSPDGRRIASGSYDRTVRIWDAETGLEIRSLTGHTLGVNSVAFSSDGRRLASGSWDRTVRIWDTETGLEVRSLTGHTENVDSVAISPDGRRLASGSYDRTVRIWDTETGLEIRSLTGHTLGVNSVAFSPDGRRLSGGSSDLTVRIWDTETGLEIQSLTGHTALVCSVAFSPDGRLIISGSLDQTVRIWDAESGEVIRVLVGHTDEVTSVAFSPDGRLIVSGSRDETVRTWDAESKREFRALPGHKARTTGVAFSSDGRCLVSGAWDRTVRIWDAVAGLEIRSLTEHSRLVSCVAFSPDGRCVVSGLYYDETVRIWDTESGQEIRTLTGDLPFVESVGFSPDGRRIVSGDDDAVRIWDAESGEEIRSLTEHTHFVASVAFSPDGRRIASGSHDRTIRIWDAETGLEMRILTGHTHYVKSVAFSADGRCVVSGSDDRTVRIWDAESGDEIRELIGHTKDVNSVAFSPDSRRIVSGSDDRTVRTWDAESGGEMQRLPLPADCLSVAYRPTGPPSLAAAVGNEVWFIAILPAGPLDPSVFGPHAR